MWLTDGFTVQHTSLKEKTQFTKVGGCVNEKENIEWFNNIYHRVIAKCGELLLDYQPICIVLYIRCPVKAGTTHAIQ